MVKLTNGIRKNGDAGLYCDDSNGFTPVFPGIVVETGFSDLLTKSRRDIKLWLECSDNSVLRSIRVAYFMQVKMGIVCKVGLNAQNVVNTLIFEIWTFDSDLATRTSPLGRARKAANFVRPISTVADPIGLFKL